MPTTLEPYLVWGAVLLIVSVAASKVSDRFGIPALLLFLGIGMLAGSDGPGGFYFDDPLLAQYLGVVALVIILFSGGLDTSWQSVRPILKEGVALATAGVLITALALGVFAHLILRIDLLEGVLLGAIVSSTDAAAVFAILRARGINLRGRLKPLLEFESGSNDPMAVFLTIAVARLLLQPDLPPAALALQFVQQLVVGLAVGIAAGKMTLYLMNRLRLGYTGLYPVLTLGAIFLAYGSATLLQGSGFLAVHLTGLVMGREEFLHKRGVMRFYDGLAWLMQIVMFLTLGLLVFPSRLVQFVLPGMALAILLMLVARPLAVNLLLWLARYPRAERLLVSWTGLRGAVPIILATYPRLLGLEQSELIFNVVFFVTLASVLLQGVSIPWAARLLKVEGAADEPASFPLETVSGIEWKGVLRETRLPPDSPAAGRAIFELGLPADYLVVLISRGKDFIVPNGSVVLQPGDKLLGLAETDAHETVAQLLHGADRLKSERK